MDNLSVSPINPALVDVSVVSTYLPGHSRPEAGQYTFAYTITIRNGAGLPVQLLSRHWVITDADEDVEEVRGEGVVGEQPVIEPGGSYRYTSGATLKTPVGYMEGSYFMLVIDAEKPGQNTQFEVPIPAFSLHMPKALH